MYKKAFNATNHINHTPGILGTFQTTTLGERVFEKYSAHAKRAHATRKANKTQALSLRHFSWETGANP